MAESYGPALDVSPPASFTFSNSTGAVLECGVSGEPAPSVSWLAGDGTPLILQHDLMTALPNGSLHYKVKMIMMIIMMMIMMMMMSVVDTSLLSEATFLI